MYHSDTPAHGSTPTTTMPPPARSPTGGPGGRPMPTRAHPTTADGPTARRSTRRLLLDGAVRRRPGAAAVAGRPILRALAVRRAVPPWWPSAAPTSHPLHHQRPRPGEARQAELAGHGRCSGHTSSQSAVECGRDCRRTAAWRRKLEMKGTDDDGSLRAGARRLSLAGAGALQHRRRCLRQMGPRRRSPGADLRDGSRTRSGASPSTKSSRPPTASPIAGAAPASRAAIASRSCCRKRPRPASRTSRPTSRAPSRCRCSRCSAREALQYRLADSGARMLVTDSSGLSKVRPLLGQLPALRVDLLHRRARSASARGSPTVPSCRFTHSIADESDSFEPVDTAAEDPAVIIYTSGTTGKPKGVLHAHRVLLGHLPGVEMSHGSFPRDGDIIWTPADWAWIGGLLDVLLPAWHHGVPVLARRFAKFDARGRVRPDVAPQGDLHLPAADRAAHAAAGAVAARTLAAGAALGGQRRRAAGQGVAGMGRGGTRPDPARVLRPDRMQHDRVGLRIAVRHAARQHRQAGARPRGRDHRRRRRRSCRAAGWATSPSGRPTRSCSCATGTIPAATADKFIGDYLVTGDSGIMDEAGFVRFVGRMDDVITSAGYRIGPGPIEDCLIGHPAVREAAVVGVPDAAAHRDRQGLHRAARRPARRATNWSGASRTTSARGCPPTSTRGRSSSSTRCRSPPPARSSARSWRAAADECRV